MKDKEKQIEEMARIIAFDLCPFGKLYAKLYENKAKCASNDNFAECTKINKVVEKLYEQGYRKLPKDSVVLSREEHEILVKTAQGKIGNMKATDFLKACISSGFMVEAVSTEEKVKQAYEKGSKETAEKIWNMAKITVDATKHIVQGREYLHLDALKEIIKNCGIEIKE